MKIYSLKKWSLLPLAGLAACTGTKSNISESEKPNVIIILTDDQGYGDLAVHGNPYLKTPNLDKLHAESIRLTDFHVAPMCAPTRGQLMTGVDCMRNGCMCTSMGRSTVKDEYPMIGEFFLASGYSTGLFGKWHMGYNYPYRPTDRGFEQATYFKGYGLTGMGHYWNSDYYDPYYFDNGELKQAKGYCNDFWFSEAINWMKSKQEENKPFFCIIPTNLPHGPEWVDSSYSKQYKNSGAEDFYGMISNVDENMGRLDKFLKENGLRENTILIYTTDNGTIHKEVYNAGMTGGKCTRTEGGHRVPCFVSWPKGGLVAPGDIYTPTQVQDILPTLIDLCALESPESAKFDGVSIAPLLKGDNIDDRMFVIQYQQNDLKKYDAAVIWNNWRFLPMWGDKLYDISTDLAEKNDVSDAHPDIVAKMKAHYEKWWEEITPHVNDLVYNHIGTMEQPEVILNSSDWMDVRADGNVSPRTVAARALSGKEFTGGIWNIDVKTAGTYTIELRRYPREAKAAICSAVPEFVPRFGDPLPAGTEIDVTKAYLVNNGTIKTVEVTKTDEAAIFEIDLTEGKTNLKAWFANDENDLVCGAYYAYVKKK